MRYQKWNIAPPCPDGRRSLEDAGVPSLLAAVLSARGVSSLEQARAQAQAQTRQMMAQAEDQAAEETRQALAQAELDCQAMKQQARGRLDQAAQLIVEKVVNR